MCIRDSHRLACASPSPLSPPRLRKPFRLHLTLAGWLPLARPCLFAPRDSPHWIRRLRRLRAGCPAQHGSTELAFPLLAQ
eukprot:8808210-Alexandrium_andersonii.AAC.1